jgi:endo-1,4-beta-mannosidase
MLYSSVQLFLLYLLVSRSTQQWRVTKAFLFGICSGLPTEVGWIIYNPGGVSFGVTIYLCVGQPLPDHPGECITMTRPFHLGVNYWPRDKAMQMWRGGIDTTRIFDDLSQIRDLGLSLVRLFLFWEDFQPDPETISALSLDDLQKVADHSATLELQLMPTFFVGHMSGVNFLPLWTRRSKEVTVGPFPHLFRRLPEGDELGDLYSEPTLIEAQNLLIRTVARRLRGHSAIYAYDLGNEPSLIRAPLTAGRTRAWASNLRAAIRQEDPHQKITVGTFQGDMEHNTGFWPSVLRECSDFLSVHGYPSYAVWADKKLRDDCLPFLVHLTRALAKGGDAMVAEFGAPYAPHGFTEDEIAGYLAATLPKLQEAGATGALVWNYSDYLPSLAAHPPFDLAPHELAFGIIRSDGSLKPSARVLADFAKQSPQVIERAPAFSQEEATYYRSPWANITELYARYRAGSLG